ncbi:MAG: YraN family protein [Flavobacteriales bacterium]|nr:hypothetical protein [Flavobacteriales bacterium]MCC6578610.1 YraN family protein [Flavobacteriales bacterium]NUQ16550.1 YraN family protein [Flavobacteriales bacterium]
MAEHLRTGAEGEQVACQWLEQQGYRILARNWRHGHLEVDIVARQGGTVVIVEVKTRRSDRYDGPADAVGPAKQRKLYRAAEAYLDALGEDVAVRFDIITVWMTGATPRIEHLEDAFYPTPDEETD